MELPTLVDLGRVGKNYEGRPVHKFLCSCGNTFETQARMVKSGVTKSCGCWRMGKLIERNTKHGLKYHPLYSVHKSMLRRCEDTRDSHYKNYGGRGINVCKEWHKLETFIADMQSSYEPGLTLDRVDNDKGYSKENCRWADKEEQARNKRNNIKFRGECAADAAKRLGGTKTLVIMRIYRGWNKEKAFTTPIKK